MDNSNKNNSVMKASRSSQVKSRPSLFSTLSEVKEQVGYEDFERVIKSTGRKYTDPLIDEICLIIAEVLVRPEKSVMRIRGQSIETGIVQEVYSKIRYEHVDMVQRNFWKCTNHIYNKSAYLQTALYNSVFEVTANEINGELG